MKNKRFVLGLMSGTSCDGLTICAIQISPFRIICFKNYSYSSTLQKTLLHAVTLPAPALAALHFKLGKLYAQKTKLFLKQFAISPANIDAVGMHGQTIYHGPNDDTPNTLQLAEPSFLAVALNCPVVSNFREKDLALGGQGAPLIPFFDEVIFGKGAPKILLNLGGIANLSIVGKNIKTYGFDCGPANTLMDIACAKYTGQPFDKNGTLASKGKADIALVNHLLKQPFFRQKPPKSLDKNNFGEEYLHTYFAAFGKTRIYDLLATLNYFTAASVAYALHHFVPTSQRKQIIVSGGGAYNKTLLTNLAQLTHLPILTSAELGIDPQAKEAAAFALMAAYALQGKKNHCPHATGAKQQTILGRITI